MEITIKKNKTTKKKKDEQAKDIQLTTHKNKRDYYTVRPPFCNFMGCIVISFLHKKKKHGFVKVEKEFLCYTIGFCTC